MNDKDKILKIFGDPLTLSSYGTLSTVEATGYFKVAKRYVHAPNVEFKPVEQADYYDIFLLQGDSILGATRTQACSQFVENGWNRVQT
jgi:hypothetical protein